MQERALDLIRSNSTNDFNKHVWSQAEFVPNSGMSADTFLQAPLRSIVSDEKEIIVCFGDNQYGAKVKLLNEFGRFIVDDVQLVAGLEESDRMSLRQKLRSLLAKGEARRPQAIQQAVYVDEAGPKGQGTPIEDDFTSSSNPPRELDDLQTDLIQKEPESQE
jgi:hypothetical protein